METISLQTKDANITVSKKLITEESNLIRNLIESCESQDNPLESVPLQSVDTAHLKFIVDFLNSETLEDKKKMIIELIDIDLYRLAPILCAADFLGFGENSEFIKICVQEIANAVFKMTDEDKEIFFKALE